MSWDELWSWDPRLGLTWRDCSAVGAPCAVPTRWRHQHGVRADGSLSILWRLYPSLVSDGERARLAARPEAIEQEEDAFARRVAAEAPLYEVSP